MDKTQIDIKENYLYRLDHELLAILLKDRSSGKNIIWATDNYAHKGSGYQKHDCIEVPAIIGYNGNVVKPRVEKSKKEQLDRIKQKAEVFTPSWVCNKQNNLVDNAWFGAENVFNTEYEKHWTATENKITFPTPDGKTWEDYVRDVRLEIICGEAPYLVSRYDTVTGDTIELAQRIGLLDRKMRVVMENTETEEAWRKWATIAFQSIYGFDWQGDNVLLARENLLLSYVDYYISRFEKEPDVEAVGKFTSCPYYGTEVLPEAPIELYKKGYAKNISIMAGSTADEARLFMGEGPKLNLEEQKIFAQRAVGAAVPYLKDEDKSITSNSSGSAGPRNRDLWRRSS